MKEQLRNLLPRFLFKSLRKGYRYGRKLYQKVNPYVDTWSGFNNYSNKDKAKSILPAKIDYINPTELCYIMKGKGTDKALYQPPGHHNYSFFYAATFQHLKHKNIRLFEMGIGSVDLSITHNMGINGRPGASLRGWREYFPAGTIYAADIDRDILFQEERIKTFYVNQLDSNLIQTMWQTNEELEAPFDIIIDDGLHTLEANKCFFENSIHKLKPGGLYIIEDVLHRSLQEWKGLIKNKYSVEYPDLKFLFLNLPNDFNWGENTLIIIEKLGA